MYNTVDTEQKCIENVYPWIKRIMTKHSRLYERVVLATKNEVVQQINETIQNMIPGEERTYKSIITLMNQDQLLTFQPNL